MKMSRVWAMPNKWTFRIGPVAELLARYKVGTGWADPFCGQSRLCELRNDLNPDNEAAEWHVEAVEFMELMTDGLAGVVFDPPYSVTQVSHSYDDMGLKFKGKENPTGGFPKVRDLIASKVVTGGHIVSFG